MSRIGSALQELHSLELLAARPTALQRLDPRAKLAVTLAFILTVVSFDRYAVGALVPLAAYPVALAALGEIPAGTVRRKLLLGAPFALTLGAFNPLVDRAPVLELGGVAIAGGWVSFTSILLRYALTVGAAVLLVAGTGFHAVCAALAGFGVPQAFTTQLLFLHRYAFVLGEEAARMSQARELRSSGRRAGLASYGPLVGHLLLRALDRAERIHGAMRSRGFDGRLHTLRRLQWTPRDTLFVAGWCAFFALARVVDLPGRLGQVATDLLA